MRTEMEEALYIQNKTIVELGEENFRLLAEIEELTAENEELNQNVCGECDSENYGWVFNRVEGRGACTCMLEAEPFQILKDALDKLARLGNGERFGNSEGNTIAREALRAVLPLDYAESFQELVESI
jgi:hypothetical protein